MNFYDLATCRFSVRDFDGRRVPKQKLKKILEAGRIAPTAMNNQPQKIYVLQSAEALEKANKATPCIYNSKTVLLICYDNTNVWTSKENSAVNSGEIDCSIVLTHMMLQAQEIGVNSCWVRRFDIEETKQIFGLPENIIPVSFMPLGFATQSVLPNPRHTEKKELSETVEFI